MKNISRTCFALIFSMLIFVNMPFKMTNSYCKKGIDVSRWNGIIDWQAVKKSGIDFAILRTTYGWSNREKFTDLQLKNNINGAKKSGINIGAYHCSYATNITEAIWEADFFIDRLKWTKWEYPVFMDIEVREQLNLSKQQLTKLALTFLNRVKRAGYYTGVYTQLGWLHKHLDERLLKNHVLWVASWNSKSIDSKRYTIWQYARKENAVPGIPEKVDLNYSYVDYPTIIKKSHLNGF